ncbi:BMP family lipoprotein [Nocardioides alcanivorans]|uniref:BMP family lipoprotein n=1 Tax=Nocardioides alcanivorans TaxID=2897352 RepID=UPI001F479B17|nr:BMP family ABC transporter substrate-binding protein [Nocardioides alcanivorans]
MKKTARVAAAILVTTLALTACGDRDDSDDNSSSNNTDSTSETTESESAAPTESHPDFKACMVSDDGGFDDKSFNQTSHDGLKQAVEQLGVQTGEIESHAQTEFEDNINEMVQAGCNSITTVGFLLGDATLKAANKNKDIDFSIVDFAYIDEAGENTAPNNLKGLTYDTAQPSYLAGYLAAAKSENGVVGTFGGVNIPTVTIFMDGFFHGVQKYNEDNDADVQVIGWDPAKPKTGSFTNDFGDKTKGQNIAEEMIGQGADVIFPVAGPAGLGGLQAAQDNSVWGIWVDTDGCVSAAEYCDSLLTSVVKGMDVSVLEAIRESANGEFTNELYEGTLENGGVSLADYGPQADIDDELDAKIQELSQQIIDGTITIG